MSRLVPNADHVFQQHVGVMQTFVNYYQEAGRFRTNPLGWVLHVAESNGGLFNYFNSRPKGSRVFSHLWVNKLGHVHQYGSLEFLSWAQAGGNSDYWSVETEGYHNEPLNLAQIAALARIHNGFRLISGVDSDYVRDRPGDRGILCHSDGGASWGGHACPGTIRAGQRAQILRRALSVR